MCAHLAVEQVWGHPAEHHQRVLLYRPVHSLSGHHLQSFVVRLVMCRGSFLWFFGQITNTHKKQQQQHKNTHTIRQLSVVCRSIPCMNFYPHTVPFFFLRGALTTSFLLLFLFCPFPPTTCWFLDAGSISNWLQTHKNRKHCLYPVLSYKAQHHTHTPVARQDLRTSADARCNATVIVIIDSDLNFECHIRDVTEVSLSLKEYCWSLDCFSPKQTQKR